MDRAQSLPGEDRRDPAALRVAVYTDYAYHRFDGEVYAERAFALFLARLATRVGRLVLVGRLDPNPGRARYALGEQIEFVALPHYPSLGQPSSALGGMARSLRHLWRSLNEVDCVWLLGPHPLALVFAAIAAIRRKRIVLGVRQDFPNYIRSRRPDRPLLRFAARLLEGSYRLLARLVPVVVVGPMLAANYRNSRELLEIAVSLVGPEDIVPVAAARERSYEDELTILSVGRLDAEKNPMMLADVLALLRQREPRWRLVVCGEGPMAGELSHRLDLLRLSEHAALRGYVPLDEGLMESYRRSHALLHTSWTEGLPQVLLEAFAAGLPVVASDVGGIAMAVDGAVRLVEAGDASGAAEQLRRIADDPALRERLIEAGNRFAHAHTIDAESGRVAEFIAGVSA